MGLTPSAASLPGITAIAARLTADAARVEAFLLQPDCASVFATPRKPALLGDVPGVVLALHGWSAGPWQFRELIPHLTAAGCYAYAPRWPGHGHRTFAGSPDANDLPKRVAWRAYADAAKMAFDEAHSLARALGLPLYLIGFSVGGAGAVQLLATHPDAIERAVLMAPFLRASRALGRSSFRLLRALGANSNLGAWVDRVPFSWHKPPKLTAAGWIRPGHSEFWLGNLYALFTYAEEVSKMAAQGLRVPCQFIVTQTDPTADPRAAQALYAASQARRPGVHRWLAFAPDQRVPHAMLTREENADDAVREAIFTRASAFLLRGE